MSKLLKDLAKFYDPTLESYKLSDLIIEQDEPAEDEEAEDDDIVSSEVLIHQPAHR